MVEGQLLKVICLVLIFEYILLMSSKSIIYTKNFDTEDSKAVGLKHSGCFGLCPSLGIAIIVARF